MRRLIANALQVVAYHVGEKPAPYVARTPQDTAGVQFFTTRKRGRRAA